MSIKAMNWAWEQKLPPNSKLILMAIADAADEDGDCWPRVKTIAKKCGVSERTVQRVLKDFITSNLLKVTPRFSHEGRQVSNNYRLNSTVSYPDNLSPHPATMSPKVTPRTTLRCRGEGDIVVSHLEPPHEPPKEPSSRQEYGLVFPRSLGNTEQKAISDMLDGRPLSYSQGLLNSLGEAIAQKKIKTSPLQWFKGALRRKDNRTSRSYSGAAGADAHFETETTYRDKLIIADISPEDATEIAYKTFMSRSKG